MPTSVIDFDTTTELQNYQSETFINEINSIISQEKRSSALVSSTPSKQQQLAQLQQHSIQIEHNSTLSREIFEVIKYRLSQLASLHKQQEQTLEQLTEKDRILRENQQDMNNEIDLLYSKGKELNGRLTEIYRKLYSQQLSKEERRFQKEIGQINSVVGDYSVKMESLKRKMEDIAIKSGGHHKSFGPEVMEKISSYLQKTTRIIETTKEDIERHKQSVN